VSAERGGVGDVVACLVVEEARRAERIVAGEVSELQAVIAACGAEERDDFRRAMGGPCTERVWRDCRMQRWWRASLSSCARSES
jgi:hypothetical protein